MKEWVVVELGKAGWIKLAREAYHFVKHGEPRERFATKSWAHFAWSPSKC